MNAAGLGGRFAQGSVTSTVSDASFASSAAALSTVRRAAIASVT